MSKVIEINNLTKTFGNVTALNNISFSLGKGKVLGFIGPNGAGKSTAIRILLGLLKANSGNATIFGKDVWKDSVAIHERIAYVPGDVHLWPNLTGGEIIDLFLSFRGVNVDKQRKETLMRRFDFDPTKKARTYSKGNRQKVALISAFAADADLYILDEPTSGLDPLQEKVFQECIDEVKTKGASVLLSSHILSEVEQLCDYVAIIRQGEIVESGTLDELRHLTRIQISLKTNKEVPELAEQKWVHNLTFEKNEAVFQLDSEYMDELISYVQPYGVIKFESAPPKLEDLFMRHYQTEEDS
ncbi:ABC transporter ATP-binding protein [Jeotgalibaca ciconiae]|uniref:ABC transporter ATP-binding protein n=1 Tax=Jeotgalibaca ciconiae TaxID=2496265 RepID=A0A3Q9BKH5_9LACT|nr:ABC transporter ATP-binding protein [Jeotgalibaca ciconiae]AZP04411.1 ABC transporter ATP-binding protein [Jeotgalibaca ciconiae]